MKTLCVPTSRPLGSCMWEQNGARIYRGFPLYPLFPLQKEKVVGTTENKKQGTEERREGRMEAGKEGKAGNAREYRGICGPHQGSEAGNEAGNCTRTVHKCSQYSWFCVNSKFFL
jgi:hypothetical protein